MASRSGGYVCSDTQREREDYFSFSMVEMRIQGRLADEMGNQISVENEDELNE